MRISVSQRVFPLKRSFTISRGSRNEAKVLVVTVQDGGEEGRGECTPYARYGESPESVAAQIEGLSLPVDRRRLLELMPPGAARNAVDCALWDLEAKLAGKRVWELAGLELPGPVPTAYTVSLDSCERMHADAAAHAGWPLLKVKLGSGREDIDRLCAVRAGAPDARIIVDANEGWSEGDLRGIAASLQELGIEMVEQPFPAGKDVALSELAVPVDLCADESCHDRSSLDALPAGYATVNIKLDKAGGLTEALELKELAHRQGFRIMVGCMMGSSLAMAPAVLLAQGADIVDLDGPVFLAEDHSPALRYDGHLVHPPDAALWG